MVFLTSPNNPDGSMIAEEDLQAILKLPVLVVLDEAYIEFSQEPSRLRWVLDHPNLVIFRTFSKSAGLAGLRVGWGESDLTEGFVVIRFPVCTLTVPTRQVTKDK